MTDIPVSAGGRQFSFPEGTSRDDIEIGIDEYFASQTPDRQINPVLQFFQKIGTGATFGFGDEISAAMTGAAVKATGGSYKDAYEFALGNIRADEEAFERQNPKLALGAEIVGGVTTGGMAGGRVLGAKAFQGASMGAKTGMLAGVGATEGALYGAGSADDNRLGGAAQGAAIGAVAAPVGTAAINLAVKGVKTGLSFLGRKITDTPRIEAVRALRAAAVAEGIDANEAVKILDDLGPNATLADLGDNFRSLARAASDSPGQFKSQARNMIEERQLGQQARLLAAAETAAGKSADEFNVARSALIASRRDAAKPLYQQAWDMGIEATESLTALMKRPALRSALAQAKTTALNEGDDATGNLLKQLHYAKVVIDDRIGRAVRTGSANQARILMGLKRELLSEIEAQNPRYIEAMDLYAGQSQMIRSMDEGAALFKTSVDDLRDATINMSESERDLFRLGAVRAIRDLLDNTGGTHDATKRLLGKKVMRDKLEMVFGDPDAFINQALSEAEFSRTRQVVAGGSPTSQNLAGQAALSDAIQPEVLAAVATGNPVMAGPALIKAFAKHKVSPELVEEMANLMLTNGMPESQVRQIFTSPAIQRVAGPAYDEVIVPIIRGAIAPAVMATQ